MRMARGLLGVSGVEGVQIQAYGLVVVGVLCLEFQFHTVQLQVYYRNWGYFHIPHISVVTLCA